MPVSIQSDPRYRGLDLALVRRQYEMEKELRMRLLAAPPSQRAEVFLTVYDELFERCPWHPALAEIDPSGSSQRARRQVQALQRFLPRNKDAQIVEIGCGMGDLLSGLAQLGYDCTGLDVSRTRIDMLRSRRVNNLHFEQAEGTRLPFAAGSFDVAISIQLFEHLHPDDAVTHLSEVLRVLKPGGVYLLETPNRWAGPGDVSRFFSNQPEGFHLCEYSIAELGGLFERVGFAQVSVVRWRKEVLAARSAIRLERLWSLLPLSLRRRRSFGLHNPLYLARKRSETFTGLHYAETRTPAVSTDENAAEESVGLNRRPEFWNFA